MKSYFTFSRQQRNGIFLLLSIIILLQCIYFFVNLEPNKISYDEGLLARVNYEMDSLRKVQLASKQQAIYPFNPNYISDFKGASLGMTNEEIDRLFAFRDQDQWINSAKQFQEVTKISDSLLSEISPYFKFPEWVESQVSGQTNNYDNNSVKTFAQK